MLPDFCVELTCIFISPTLFGWTFFSSKGSRIRQAPHISPGSKLSFFQAVKDCHQELITPPRSVASDPKKLKNWNPPCITKVDWKQVETEGVEKRDDSQNQKHEDREARDDNHEKDGEWRIPDYLTIGLIGELGSTKRETPASFSSLMDSCFHSLFLLITFARSTKCRKVLSLKRSSRIQSSSSFQNSW